MNSTDPSGLLAILRRRRKSVNGVFGIKVTAVDVMLYGEAEFYSAFDEETVIFNLWRDNLVAQGVSLYRAVSTGRFHSWGADEAAIETPVYDRALIRQSIQHVADYENQNLLMLARHAYCPRMLRYEDIVRSRTTAISIFADAMRVDLPGEQPTGAKSKEPRKIGDDWNRAMEMQFRREEAEFLHDIEARRLIKREPQVLAHTDWW
jgi:LPS sulfotransferase NodH